MAKANTKGLVTESMRKKWTPVIEGEDSVSRGLTPEDITIRLLENQSAWNRENLGYDGISESTLNEADNAIGNATSTAGRWAPVLIAMAKRLAPINIANEFFGVQPLPAPDGQIFALRARKGADAGAGDNETKPELFMSEADSAYSGDTTTAAAGDPSGFTVLEVEGGTGDATATVAGKGMSTAAAELLGATGSWSRVGITIQKAQVSAKSRGLYADYSQELRQDMMAVHGEDVDSILADVMVTEIGAEINREMIRHMNVSAVKADQFGAGTGVIDMANDVGGRWDLERWKYLMFILEVEANRIAVETRRGKGNKVLCHPNVASALVMAGMLDYSPALAQNRTLTVDPTAQSFAGVLANGMQVFIDPYAGSINYATVAFKGLNQLDAGYFYCPYVPLEMFRATGQDSFQPRMAFKTRYGVVANPFVQIPVGQSPQTAVTSDGIVANSNSYFRKIAFKSLLG